MTVVRVDIVRFADGWQPGFVECRLADLSGRVWSFEEKVPIVSADYLDAGDVYPRPGSIDCVVLGREGDVVRIRIDPIGGSFECDVPSTAFVDEHSQPRVRQ